jgi:glucokinase
MFVKKRLRMDKRRKINNFVIGADIGGSHIACRIFDLKNNCAVGGGNIRLTVNSRASAGEITDCWSEAIKKTSEYLELKSLSEIGFAMPGPFDYRNGIAWFKGVNKFDNLYGMNIKEELRQKLELPHEMPLRFLNDASCFAIGEAWLGKAPRYKKTIALTLGTGFGSTFIEKGLPAAGIEGIPEDGFLYRIPFKGGIADDFFSSRWFTNEYKIRTGKEIEDVKTLAENAKRNAEGKKLFHTFGTNLGVFLASWVNAFNAECIVLGGNISKSFPLFKNPLQAALAKKGLNPFIYSSVNSEMTSLYGGAKLCDDAFYHG